MYLWNIKHFLFRSFFKNCFVFSICCCRQVWVLGIAGSDGVVWGNWESFVNYSSAVNSFVSKSFNEILAILATALELILPLFLLLGYKLKQVAFFSGMLLLAFALSMTISFGIKPPFDYFVWTGADASFLLSAIGCYSFSVDEWLKK